MRLSTYQAMAMVGALLGVVAVDLPKAQACLTDPGEPDFGWGEPADGASGVPTDVIPYYPIPFAALMSDSGVPGTFMLKTMAGVEVTVTPRRVHYWNYELVPDEALAPDTEYELTGSWLVGTEMIAKTIHFTTGAGPLEGAPEMPAAMLEHYRIMVDAFTSCDPWPTGTCLSFGDPALMVEYTHVDELGQHDEPYLGRGSAMIDIAGIDQGTPYVCVELRTRAMNGALSEPQTLCREDGALFELTSTDVACTPDGLTSSTKKIPGIPDAGGLGTGDPDGGDVALDDDAESEETATPEQEMMRAGASSEPSNDCTVTRPRAATLNTRGAWAALLALGLLYRRRR